MGGREYFQIYKRDRMVQKVENPWSRLVVPVVPISNQNVDYYIEK